MNLYKVEYLLLIDDGKASCNTVEALKHLLQSDSDITISDGTVRYKDKLEVGLQIVKGSVEVEKPQPLKTVYFDLTFTCKQTRDFVLFSSLLRSIRKVTAPLLANATALQVLRDDLSTYYANRAYPKIAYTENLMRKLITKFMHINVGLAWVDERIPDDVQKSVNAENTDSTYLYNVDFIKLKDILLSESYSKDRDALIKELKTSGKANFRREEISSLVPTSNWEKYFSSQVNCSAEELESLWKRLYDLRCKVAHNKTFTQIDLNTCEPLAKKLDAILEGAISKLDDIHIDKDEAQEIVEDVVSSASSKDSSQMRMFLAEWRKFGQLTYRLTTPLQKKSSGPRLLSTDIRLLLKTNYIDDEQFDKIQALVKIRNRLFHKINDESEIENWNTTIADMRDVITRLQRVELDQSGTP